VIVDRAIEGFSLNFRPFYRLYGPFERRAIALSTLIELLASLRDLLQNFLL
jgi:hypothetical protein